LSMGQCNTCIFETSNAPFGIGNEIFTIRLPLADQE
jgi:hypothetical protein